MENEDIKKFIEGQKERLEKMVQRWKSNDVYNSVMRKYDSLIHNVNKDS